MGPICLDAQRSLLCRAGAGAGERLDLFKEAGGGYKAIRREYRGAEATDGELMITFTPKVKNPAINNVELPAE